MSYPFIDELAIQFTEMILEFRFRPIG